MIYPRCLGHCDQGRRDCETHEQCTGALLLRHRQECRAQHQAAAYGRPALGARQARREMLARRREIATSSAEEFA